jgi:hypothetical protein
MKPVPKHLAAAARAQFFLIGRALVHAGISRDTFETLIHEWLAIIAPLLKDSGFEGVPGHGRNSARDLTRPLLVALPSSSMG